MHEPLFDYDTQWDTPLVSSMVLKSGFPLANRIYPDKYGGEEGGQDTHSPCGASCAQCLYQRKTFFDSKGLYDGVHDERNRSVHQRSGYSFFPIILDIFGSCQHNYRFTAQPVCGGPLCASYLQEGIRPRFLRGREAICPRKPFPDRVSEETVNR